MKGGVGAAGFPAPAPDSQSQASAQMTAEMERLKGEGKLTSNRMIASAVRNVINSNSTQHEISAPTGARVIAVHKQPGDIVRVGDKIVTLLVDGKKVPILAKQAGVMQTINVSKGGLIGNSRPRAAKAGGSGGGSGVILLTLRSI